MLAEQPTPFKCDGCNKGFTARCYLSSHQNHCAPWLALTERRKRLRPAAAPVEAPPEVPMEGPAEVRMEALAEAPAEAPEEEAPAEAPEEAYEDLQEPDVRNVPELAQVREILSRYAGLKAADPNIRQAAAAVRLGISQSMLSRYLKKAHRISGGDLCKRKHIEKKIECPWKDEQLRMERLIYHKLKRLCDKRSDSLDPATFPTVAQRVADKKGFPWREWKYPNKKPFAFSAKWMQGFCRSFDVKAVAPRTTKACSPGDEVRASNIFHAKLRAILQCVGPIMPTDVDGDDITRAAADPLHGRFRPADRINIDQVAPDANHTKSPGS